MYIPQIKIKIDFSCNNRNLKQMMNHPLPIDVAPIITHTSGGGGDVGGDVGDGGYYYQLTSNNIATSNMKQQEQPVDDNIMIMDYQVREYIRERRIRKLRYEMCCVCCTRNRMNPFACDPRLPMADLINENVLLRVVVWMLFARLYFEVIYATRVFLLLSDDYIGKVIDTCSMFGSSMFTSTTDMK